MKEQEYNKRRHDVRIGKKNYNSSILSKQHGQISFKINGLRKF